MIKIFSLLCICFVYANGELYTAMVDLDNLLQTEKHVVAVSNFVNPTTI